MCDPLAAEMQLSRIITTILIDVLYRSVSVICCDFELRTLYHRFGWILRLTLRWLTASLQVVQTLLLTESPSANSKSPLILHAHKACVCQDETGDWNRHTLKKIRGCSKIISVCKMHVNVPISSLCDSGLTAEMEAAGLLSFWKNMKQLQVCDYTLLSCCGPK